MKKIILAVLLCLSLNSLAKYCLSVPIDPYEAGRRIGFRILCDNGLKYEMPLRYCPVFSFKRANCDYAVTQQMFRDMTIFRTNYLWDTKVATLNEPYWSHFYIFKDKATLEERKKDYCLIQRNEYTKDVVDYEFNCDGWGKTEFYNFEDHGGTIRVEQYMENRGYQKLSDFAMDFGMENGKVRYLLFVK